MWNGYVDWLCKITSADVEECERVCVWEREREREIERERERKRECVCVLRGMTSADIWGVREREREKEREKEKESLLRWMCYVKWLMQIDYVKWLALTFEVCECVCVCGKERERERGDVACVWGGLCPCAKNSWSSDCTEYFVKHFLKTLYETFPQNTLWNILTTYFVKHFHKILCETFPQNTLWDILTSCSAAKWNMSHFVYVKGLYIIVDCNGYIIVDCHVLCTTSRENKANN